jgi:MFS family permease
MTDSHTDADSNWRRFVWFRVLFNARFYYPVLAILFLDLGLSATQYTLLNFAWALAIVAVDLPAGVLADRIGRRPLVVAAAASMVIEMVLLAVAPRNGGVTLFLCCLANRLLSGAAEGMASGADEALVFDSLAERGRESEWPLVLDQVMRWQSFGFVIAMLAGGAVYDPHFINGLFGWHLTQGTTLRFPIYLNLLSALATLAVAVDLREPGRRPAGGTASAGGAFAHLLEAGRWIAQTPLALFVIVAGVALDSVVRLFMTFSSSYFRLIGLPAASYGLIGAALGSLGLAVSPLARRMVAKSGPAANFAVLAGVTLAGLAGVALRWPIWGVLFVIPLGMAMSAVAYFASYYLNAAVDAHRRATVLSFKGLAFNLGYGFISLAFAGALRALRAGNAEATFGRTLPWLPVWLLAAAALVTLAFWTRRAALSGGKILASGGEA